MAKLSLRIAKIRCGHLAAPIAGCLSLLSLTPVGCAVSASELQASQAEQQISAMYPGFRAELLSFEGKAAWGVAKIEICGPFKDYIDQSGAAALFEPALDNASRTTPDGSSYAQPFNHFVLQWSAADNSITPAPIGLPACEQTRGQACTTRANPLGNEAWIDGVLYVHNFASHLEHHPQVARLLGEPVGMALRYNERNAVRHYFENGALEYNGHSQHVGLVPLGAQTWRAAGGKRSPLPGLCFVDSRGQRQVDYAIHAWHSPTESSQGAPLIGFGAPIGPAPNWTSGICSSLASAVVCGIGAIVVLGAATIPLIAKLTPDSGSAGSNRSVTLTSHVVLLSALLGTQAYAGNAFALMLTPPTSLAFQQVPPTVLLVDRQLSFGQPFPPHFIPGAEGRPGPELRQGILGGILTKAGMEIDAGIGVTDVLAQLQQREAELRRSAGLMNNGMTDWLHERLEMTDEELAELAAPVGKSAGELRAWLEEALKWAKEEARQLEEAAEAFGDAQERVEDAVRAAEEMRQAAHQGSDPTHAIDKTAEQLVANVKGLTQEQQIAAVKTYEDEIRAAAMQGVIGEQAEEMALQAARRARELLGLAPP